MQVPAGPSLSGRRARHKIFAARPQEHATLALSRVETQRSNDAVYEKLVVFLLYTGLAVAMTYPADLSRPHKSDRWTEDNFHFLWELWYVAHALFDVHKSPFFDPDVFVPFGFSLIRIRISTAGNGPSVLALTHYFR